MIEREGATPSRPHAGVRIQGGKPRTPMAWIGARGEAGAAITQR
jgi:hypothetical protein